MILKLNISPSPNVQFDIFTLEFAENDFLACPGIVSNDVPDRFEEGLLRPGGHLKSAPVGEQRR